MTVFISKCKENRWQLLGSRVADPYTLDPDPIWIQGFDNKKCEKNLQLKMKFIFWITNYNLSISRPPEKDVKLQKKPSALQTEHPELQNKKFKKKFRLLWVIFGLLDPDPDPDPLTRWNPDPIRIQIRIQIRNPIRISRKYDFY